MASCGKNVLSENQIFNDQTVLAEIANWLGMGYDIEIIDIYNRQIDDNDDYVYCNFEAQNVKLKIVGQICIVYHRYEQGWSMTNCRAVDQDRWEIVPLQGVSEETILENVKYASKAKGELEIIDRDTDLENLRDIICVQEIRTINQLRIINTYDVIYGFDQASGMWENLYGCRLIDQKNYADIVGKWVGYDNGEYFYVNILECGEDGNISVEFSFPRHRWYQSTIQVSGTASGAIDLVVEYPNYLLKVESKEEGTSYLNHFWISFNEVSSNNQIFVTTDNGLTCILKRIEYKFMPDVIGKTVEEARKILDDSGLRCQVKYEESDGVDAGIVISTDFVAGSEISEDGTASESTYVCPPLVW